MNKKVKQSIISIVLTILVVIISILSFHYIHKNTINYDNINESINVQVYTKKDTTTVSTNNEDTIIEKYTINVNTEEFYHYKLVLENSHNVTYTLLIDEKEIVLDENLSNGTNTIYEGEFTDYTQNYEVIIKINNEEDTSYENKIYFVY